MFDKTTSPQEKKAKTTILETKTEVKKQLESTPVKSKGWLDNNSPIDSEEEDM